MQTAISPCDISKRKGYWTGKHLSAATRKKISDAMLGEKHHSWKGGDIKITCKICGTQKYVKRSEIKRGKGFLCSKKCMGIWNSHHRTGKDHPNWKEKIKINCRTCGKEKYIKQSKPKHGGGIFCSLSCTTIWRLKHSHNKETSIERIITDELIRRNIFHKKQVPLLGITLVDFLLPPYVVIYADGDYWHSFPKTKIKDANQDFVLSFYGYKVFRFRESEIHKSVKKCIDKVCRRMDADRYKPL